VPLPTLLGDLHLFITATRIMLLDADDAAFITVTRIQGVDNDGTYDPLDSDFTNKYTIGANDDTSMLVDCGGHEAIRIQLVSDVDIVGELDVLAVLVSCYYALPT